MIQLPKKKILIALGAAIAVVVVWYEWRAYNTQQYDASLGFDETNYNTISDSTDWDNYVPLSLEVPN